MNTFKTRTKGIFLVLTVILFASNVDLSAQYKVNKLHYDYRAYAYEIGDPYQPGVCGVVSFLIPGVGQMISHEVGRGVGFLGGYIGCYIIMEVGLVKSSLDIDEGGTGSEGMALAVAGIIGAIAVDIWSTVDAVRVAKVNNMAWRDQYRKGTGLKISPDIRFLPGQKVAPSLTLAYRF